MCVLLSELGMHAVPDQGRGLIGVKRAHGHMVKMPVMPLGPLLVTYPGAVGKRMAHFFLLLQEFPRELV